MVGGDLPRDVKTMKEGHLMNFYSKVWFVSHMNTTELSVWTNVFTSDNYS